MLHKHRPSPTSVGVRLVAAFLVAAALLASAMLLVSAAGAPATSSKVLVAGTRDIALAQAKPGAGTTPLRSDESAVEGLIPVVRQSLKNDVSPALRSITPELPPRDGVALEQREIPRLALPGRQWAGADRAREPRPYGRMSQGTLDQTDPQAPVSTSDVAVREGDGETPPLQAWHGLSPMPSPLQSFDGLSNSDNERTVVGRIMPPDTQGDVGPAHYVQWVNLVFAVWDRSGTLLYGPAAGSTLWSGFGGPCEGTNDGDPITLYDPLADRWLMSQFSLPSYPNGPFYQCIAVSVSGDPTGSWYRYAFEWENGAGQAVMNDYPKFAVWPDGYYLTVNQFLAGELTWAGTGVAVFEREQMLQGRASRIVYYDLGPSDWGGMLPADLDGSVRPPSGAPCYFVEANADEWEEGLQDELQVYEFHVNWGDPLNSTFSQTAALRTALFDGDLCGFSQNCIAQPGTTQKLDAVADRLMHRLQYRNFGSYETLVTNLTVDADGTDHAGIRWYELRRTSGTWTIHQQGTYAPDGENRWMGSVAMDKAGNMALGYSVSSDQTYPSVRYAGRLAGDPLGTLPQAEVELASGSSFQAGGNRWGDYSMMAVDPVDDCTFWYTQQYVAEPGTWGNWATRVGSFRFPNCLGPTGSLEGVVKETGTGAPIIGARIEVESNPVIVTYSQAPDGRYRFELVPAGSYRVKATAYGFGSQTASRVLVDADHTTRLDFQLSPVDRHVLYGVVKDAATDWPLYAQVIIDGRPGDPIWTDPVTGFYSATLATETTYQVHVNTWGGGYQAVGRTIGPLTRDQNVDFSLQVDTEACVAPGYNVGVVGVYESFEDADSISNSAPPGWTVVDHASNGQVWQFDDPGNRGNMTGGGGAFAIVDSDNYGAAGYQDTELRTPLLDFSGLVTALLEFDTDYLTFVGNDVADVDVSVDGGQVWTNVWRRNGSSYRGPAHEVVDISSLAAGQPDVMARFHFYNASWEWWWQVDNILAGQSLGCQVQAAGVVVGNVYDENTGQPLVGAEVAIEGGGEVVHAAATPLDPLVDDAFFAIFLPAGQYELSAKADGGYETLSLPVTVAPGTAVRQDFRLLAGRLSYTPSRVDIRLGIGLTTTVPFTLSNQGGLAVDYEIRPQLVGFEPEGAALYRDVTIPGDELTYDDESKVAKRRTAFRPDVRFTARQVWRPTGEIKVLLLTPDAATGGDISLIQNTLGAFPDLEVTLWDGGMGPPIASDLAAYDVVIVGNDILWSAAFMDAEAVGDALADYIDAGGRLIDTLFVHDYEGWQLGGRYIEGGYAPFTASTTDLNATPYTLGTVYDPFHPIMSGVTSIRDNPTIGIGHQDVGVAAGARRLADWSDGEVFVAHNDRVVGVNQLWYQGANWTGDVPTLMHNAILYLAESVVDWLWVDPVSGTVAVDGQQQVAVSLDAGAASVTQPGRYRAALYLKNDSPYGNPAVPVTMTVAASPVCTEVTEVDLRLLTSGAIYTNTQVTFSADILPYPLFTPYSYAMAFGDGADPVQGSSSEQRLHFETIYSAPGIYQAEISVWNCDLLPAQAVTDRVGIRVYPAIHRTFLPTVAK